MIKITYFIINKVGQRKYNFVLDFDFASKSYMFTSPIYILPPETDIDDCVSHPCKNNGT